MNETAPAAAFLTPSAPLPPYLAYPRFLRDMNISETAKLVYAMLLDRARLSMKNDGWTDENGKIFLYFTIANLATAIHRSEMTVQTDNFLLIGEQKNCLTDGLLDQGVERDTEYALEQVFNVIDARVRSNLPLIVTTNLTLDELKHPVDLAHERIYSRVLERCVPLKINNQNIRQLKAHENFLRAKQLLTDTKEEKNDD